LENSKIAWTHHTFNPWVGCTKVGPGCENCYAKTLDGRHLHSAIDHWGPGAPREIASETNWQKPTKWDRRAGAKGIRARVFCASMADVFDKEAPCAARERLWKLIRSTPNLDWLILTKRPEKIQEYLPQDWGSAGYTNVWLGTTCEDRKHGFPRVDALRAIPAKVHFVSCEPLLEDISDINLSNISWLITGGESGRKARAFDVAWARALRELCAKSNVRFFVKQMGARPIECGSPLKFHRTTEGKRDIDGRSMDNFPADLRIQEFPSTGSTEIDETFEDEVPEEALDAILNWLQKYDREDSILTHLAECAIASITGLILANSEFYPRQ
jgi:protein gp37